MEVNHLVKATKREAMAWQAKRPSKTPSSPRLPEENLATMPMIPAKKNIAGTKKTTGSGQESRHRQQQRDKNNPFDRGVVLDSVWQPLQTLNRLDR